MLKTGKYIYGLISTPGEAEEKIFSGIDAKLKLVHDVEISAVTADAEIVDIFSLDNKQIAWKLVEHQQTIEKIMNAGFSIVPMKLGTYLGDNEEVEKILKAGHHLIKNSIDKVKNKIEFDVVACWTDFGLVLKEIGELQEIKSLRNLLMSNPQNITAEQKMKIGVMVAKALEQKKNDCAERIVNSLREVSISAVQNEVMNDEMLLNTAFMLDKERIKSFEDHLNGLDSEFDNAIKFKCIGPLPCYNFCTLEILDVDSNSIERAVKLLELGVEADLAQIKSAYKIKAMKVHPDRNKDAKDDKFNELNKAFLLLSSYYKAFAFDGYCSFAKEKVLKNTKLIKLKD